MTVFEKMGHPAKKLEMPFLVSIDSFFCARNYDIFIIFLAYSVIMLRAVVFRYIPLVTRLTRTEERKIYAFSVYYVRL